MLTTLLNRIRRVESQGCVRLIHENDNVRSKMSAYQNEKQIISFRNALILAVCITLGSIATPLGLSTVKMPLGSFCTIVYLLVSLSRSMMAGLARLSVLRNIAPLFLRVGSPG